VGIVSGVTHGNARGWTDDQVVETIAAGFAFTGAFLARESRAAHPMLPLKLFSRRASVVANGVSFLMSFGLFGSIFLLSQFFQIVQSLNPLDSGIRILPWTFTPVIVRPYRRLRHRQDQRATHPRDRHGLDVHRPGLDCRRHLRQRLVPEPGARLRDQRREYGPLLRPDRQRGPVGGAAQRRGQGLRR
jgi:hypothetical protein